MYCVVSYLSVPITKLKEIEQLYAPGGDHSSVGEDDCDAQAEQ